MKDCSQSMFIEEESVNNVCSPFQGEFSYINGIYHVNKIHYFC